MGLLESWGITDDFHADTPKVDKGALGYQEGSLGQQRLGGYAQGAQGRQGPRVDYGNANADRAMSDQSRGTTNEAIDMMRQAALGNVPSRAELQMRQGVEQGLAAQVAGANSARGAGMAGAQRNAAYMGGELQAAANQQGAQLRAEEMAQARQQFAQAAFQRRMQDLQSMGMSYDAAFKQSQLEMQQRELNDRYQLGLEGLSAQIGLGELQARTAGEGLGVQGSLGAQGINAGVVAGQNEGAKQLVGGIVGAGAGIATGGMSLAAQQAASQSNGGRWP